MKVSPAAAYQYYKSYKATGGAETASAKPANAKTDTISISGKATQSSPAARLAQDITAQLETSTPRNRIETLKAAVEKNEYNVSSEAIADSIMGALGLNA